MNNIRDLLTKLEQINEASVSNLNKYPYGTTYSLSDGVKGQALGAQLATYGINTDDPIAIVDPSEVSPDGIEAQIGSGKTQWVFKDINEQYFVINGTPDAYFVHAGNLANRGELAEGILGAAMFSKFTKREGGEGIGLVNSQDIAGVLDTLKSVGNDTYQVDVQDSNHKHADRVTYKLVLKTKPYQDLMDPAKRDLLKQEFSSAAAYVNSDRAERYSKYFYLNGRADDIAIICNGATRASESSSKIDVWVAIRDPKTNTMRRLKLNASLKAGPVKQFGQVGGSESKSMLKLWSYFGIDVTPWLKEYEKAQGNDQFEALSMMYKKVSTKLSAGLKKSGPKGEAEFVAHLAKAVTFFATLDDPAVELVQFDKGGFKILRFQNLVEKFKSVDMTATYVDTKARPEINIHDVNNPKNILITIRAKIETKKNGELYVRNIIEKGKLLEELTKVQTKSWSDEQTSAKVTKAGTAHTIGADVLGKTKKTSAANLGRERR